MTVSSHLDQLRLKHRGLEEQIREVERSPGADHLEVAELKRKKLQVKERITRLSETTH